MGEAMHPNGTRLLSDTEVGDEWVDLARIFRKVFLFGNLALLPALLLPMSTFMIILVCAQPVFLSLARRNTGRRLNLISQISLSEGHPWHDAEVSGETIVYVRDLDEAWQSLPKGARLFATQDPLLGRTLLRDGDADGAVLVRWNTDADPALVTLINMAQALADAQDRAVDDEDPFEGAREREGVEESLLEREWEDTDEGSLEYKPGALIRALKRGKTDE